MLNLGLRFGTAFGSEYERIGVTYVRESVYGLESFWMKLWLLSDECAFDYGFQDEPVLYLDLDVLPLVDDLGCFKPVHGCLKGVREFLVGGHRSEHLQGSVWSYYGGELDFIWQHFFTNRDRILRTYPTDQHYLWTEWGWYADFFPDSWSYSWKRGVWNPEAKLCVWHGLPRPHEVMSWWPKKAE
jgi:hypothetical protein